MRPVLVWANNRLSQLPLVVAQRLIVQRLSAILYFAVAINLLRVSAWLNGTPPAQTRQSSFARLMAQAA
jgi:hypothetical protein